MALLPWFSSEVFSQPSHNDRNNFGRAINPQEFDFLPLSRTLLNHPLDSGTILKKIINKDGFEVCLDVRLFAPNDISLKAVDDVIVVEGKHEERPDEHGYISRQFTRRYVLPQGFNIKDVDPQLSSDGILTIKAPPEIKPLNPGNVQVLQIQQTGPARLNYGLCCCVESKDD